MAGFKIGFIMLLVFATTLCKAQTKFKFDFGTGKVQKGYTQVLPETKYSPAQGYGFEFSGALTAQSYKGNDALRDDYITSNKPFTFL